MHTYLLVARGMDLATAEVLAVSANPDLVARFARELTAGEPRDEQNVDERRDPRLHVVASPGGDDE